MADISKSLCLFVCFRFFFRLFADTVLPKHNADSCDYGFVIGEDKSTRFFCLCGRKYTRERDMKYHQKWDCGRELKCPNCHKNYKDIQYFRAHKKMCSYAGITE